MTERSNIICINELAKLGKAVATQLNHMLPWAPDGVKEFVQTGSLTLAHCSLHRTVMMHSAWHQQFPFAKYNLYPHHSFTQLVLSFSLKLQERWCMLEDVMAVVVTKWARNPSGQVKCIQRRSSTAKCRLSVKITCNYLTHPTVISRSGPTRGTERDFY